MKETHAWLRLTWPREVDADIAERLLLVLHGLASPRHRQPLVWEVVGRVGAIEHRLRLPAEVAQAAEAQLPHAVPGLGTVPIDEPYLSVVRAWRVWLSTNRRALDHERAELVATGLLSALGAVERDEELLVQWLLGPVRRPLSVPSTMPGEHSDRWLPALVRAPFSAPGTLDAEARKALLNKQGVAGWRALGRVAVRATSRPRQLQLLGRMSASLRLMQAPGVEVGINPSTRRAGENRRVPLRWPVALNVHELTGILAIPLGETPFLPIAKANSRTLPPSRNWSSNGRVVAMGTHPGHERPLCISIQDSLLHTWLLGPTGSGKSVLLQNLVAQDLAAGRGCIVIEPKGDLVNAVLEQVPANRLDDIVVLDPSDRDRPVGLNPLSSRRHPELAVDGLLAVFKGLFGDAIGPRTQDLLAAGLLTLARSDGHTLLDLPRLFVDAGFRRSLTKSIHDPIALGPFFAWFDKLSPAETQQVLAPLMNKLRAFLLRDAIRGIVGQRQPRFDISRVFTDNKVLLVSLGKGAVGTEAAQLLGSLVFSEVWRAILGRGGVSPDRRTPTFVYVDEFQDYLRLPTDLADVLAQSRGYGVGLNLAHQHAGQLSAAVRAAVMANARNRVTFALGHDDAALLARGQRLLKPEDYEGLGRFEVYAQAMSDGQALPPASGRTAPSGPPISDARVVRERSRELYGVAVEEMQDMRQGGHRSDVDTAIGRVLRLRGEA